MKLQYFEELQIGEVPGRYIREQSKSRDRQAARKRKENRQERY